MKKRKTILLAAIVWLLALIFASPLLLVLINSFKTKGEIMTSAISLPSSLYLGNFVQIMTESNFLSSFFCSVFVVAVTTSLTVLVAAVTGYALARWNSRLCRILILVIMSTLFVPFQVYMVALIVVVRNLHLVNNIIGLILVYLALGMPVPIFLCRSYCVGCFRLLHFHYSEPVGYG